MATRKILIGGGSGFIGSHLSRTLRHKGYEVSLISRTAGPNKITWSEVERKGLPSSYGIVQIPGAPLMDKAWTAHRKKELLDSRIKPTELLVRAIKLMPQNERPKVLVSGSAVGYYPFGDDQLDESYSGPPGDNFAGELCSKWEKVTKEAEIAGVRKVFVRTGIVLGRDGGALKQMYTPFFFGVGGPMGSGNQFWPWIHIDDLVGIFVFALENSKVEGVINGTSPSPARNKEFAATLGSVMKRPAIIPMPEFVLKMIFGERAPMLTGSQKIFPQQALNLGYTFQHPDLREALQDLLGKK